ncbi:MAG: polymerase sigma factor RpoD, partial [Verrucomicrobiota bacterium]
MPDKNAKKNPAKGAKASAGKTPVKATPAKTAAKPDKAAAKATAKAPAPTKPATTAKSPVKAPVAKVTAAAGKVQEPSPKKATPAGKTQPKPVPIVKPVPGVKPLATPVVPKGVNEKVQQLVSLSKKNGYVTVQNINEVIPDSATDPELIENIMNILDNLDIKLLDEDEVEAFIKKVEDSEEEASRTVPADAPYDPFNVYLKQMGHKPLLTREQEVEISKRIEDAELRAQDFLFSIWL